jgi:hypothetical protein
MTQIVIDIGAAPNDGTGDPLRTAFNDVNLNFANVFAAGPVDSNVRIANNAILTTNTNGNLVLNPNGVGVVQANAHVVPDQNRIRNLGSQSALWNTTYTQYLQTTYANIGTANIANIGVINIPVANLHILGGSNGYVLQTDGTGNLTWTAQTGGSGNGVPSGANTQIQYNNAGSFGASAGFTFNSTSNALSVPGNITANGNILGGNILGNISAADGNGSVQFNYNGFLSADAGFNYDAVANTLYVETINVSGKNARGVQAAYVGVTGFTPLGSNVVAQFAGNADSYTQINFQNISNGSGASGDYIVTANNGTDSTYYLDLGLAGNNHADPDFFGDTSTANDGYLYVTGADQTGPSDTGPGNLILGSTNGVIKMFVGNTAQANVVATVDSNGIVMNNTPSGPSNQIKYGTGNLVSWLDGGWVIGEYNGTDYGTEGVRISPGIEGNVEVNLPSNQTANVNPLQLSNYVGNVIVSTGFNTGNSSGSSQWKFGGDGTTEFPDNTIKTANNQPLAIQTRSSGNAYSTMYQSSGHWEAYAEDDQTGADSAWAWIYAELPTVDTPQVWIENKTGSDGISNRWSFDAVGNLTLPNIANPSINYANGTPYGGAVNKIANGNSFANVEFPSGNLAVGVNLQNVTGAWINTYGNIVVNDQNNTVGESVIVDEGGNVYVTGSVYNNDFGYDQAFVRKLNYTGAVMWQKALPAATDGSDESSGESLAIDGAGNLYWLSNLWGGSIQDGSALVVKMNSSTGESVWSTLVQGGQYAQDITVTGAGQVFVTCDNNARITSLNTSGAVLWSFDPGNGGASLLDLGTFVLVGYGNGTVGAYNYDGDLLWTNQVFDTGNEVWGLASDGTDWYAADRDGYIMKISGADNSTILWQKYINRDGTGGGMFLTWIEYSDGYIYAGGTGNDGSGNYAFITVKILASDGTLTWARGLGASDTVGQWYWYGHQDLAVSGSNYLITGYARPAQANANKQVLARLPTDGSLAGSTVGPYYYVNIPALTVDSSDVGGAGYSTPAQPNAIDTTQDYTLNILIAPYAEENILSPFTTGPVWSFNSDGNLVVPGSINSTTNNSLSLNVFNEGDNPSLQLFNWDVANTAPSTIISVDPNLISITTNITGNTTHDWTFNALGQTVFPVLNTQRGDNPGGTITGYTLLGGSGNQEFIISTPDGITGYDSSQRLVINPGKGRDGTAGEGGDIYLWAGRGGNGSGSGGDIKVRGGQGGANTAGGNGGDGGYIRIEAGDAADQGGSPGYVQITGGIAGYITPGIAGGYVNINGGEGQNGNGGNTSITGGYGGTGYLGGDVNLTGGGSSSGLANYGNVNISAGATTWRFDKTGKIVGSGNLLLAPNSGNLDAYLDIYVTTGPDIHIAGNGENVIIGRDTGANIMVGVDGNVTIRAEDGSAKNWTFDTDGNLSVPGNTLIYTPIATGSAGGNSITIQAGSSDSFSASPGGNLNLIGGYGSFGDGGGPVGGAVNITGGGSQDNQGGNVNIAGGTGTSGGSVFLNSPTYTPPVNSGLGIGESAIITGTRRAIGGYINPTYAYTSVLNGTTSSVVYQSNQYAYSVKVTFAIQSSNVSWGWEQFDVVAVRNLAGGVTFTVSNRVNSNPENGDTAVSAQQNGGTGAIEIYLQQPGSGTAYVTYDAVEFNQMVD